MHIRNTHARARAALEPALFHLFWPKHEKNAQTLTFVALGGALLSVFFWMTDELCSVTKNMIIIHARSIAMYIPPGSQATNGYPLSLPFSTAGRHHKAADTLADRNVITRLFYGCYPFFAFCCVGTELFYVALYLLVFVPEASFALGGGVAVSLRAVSVFLLVVVMIVDLFLPFLWHDVV